MSLSRDFASGFLMGTGLGVSLTLLLAPRTGAETRRAIADKKRQVKDEASAKASDYRDRGRLAIDKAREALGETKQGLRDVGRALTEPQRRQSS